MLLGIGFGVGKLVSLKKDNPAPATTPRPTEEPIVDPQANAFITDIPESVVTKTFESRFPSLEFTYPETWVVTESDNGVRIESPELTYQTVEGEKVTGPFRLYMRQGAREVDSKYIARGIAALPSEKLAYSEPHPGQRKETNLSFFGLDESDHFAFLFIAGNFNLSKGQSLGPSYGKEPQTYIISGGFSSADLKDDLATNKVFLDAFQDSNAYRQAIEIIKSLKL